MNDTAAANPFIAALQVIIEKRQHVDARQPDDDQTDRPDQDTPQAKPRGGRWREKKMIPGKNGKLYGPYWYERWREDGKCRSRYIGKA